MTISSDVRVAGPFIGNGVTTAFPFAFKVFSSADVVVTNTVIATGVSATLSFGGDCTLALNADQDTNPGGVVTYTPGGVPMTSANELSITSNVAAVQTLDLTNSGGFFPRAINAALDKMVVLIQQITSRAVRAPAGDPASGSGMVLPALSARRNKFLACGSAGEIIPAEGTGTTTDAALVYFTASGASAKTRTVQDKGRDAVSFFDKFTSAQKTDVRASAAAVDVGTAIADAISEAPAGGRIDAPPGKYSYATSPNFALNQLEIVGEGQGSIFNHTGSGKAFNLDYGNTPPTDTGYINGMHLKNITVQGNPSSSHGFVLVGVGRSLFECITSGGCAATGDGIRVEFGVCDLFVNPKTGAGYTPQPANGLHLLNYTTACTFLNPVFEGMTAVNACGVFIDTADANLFLGGTFEDCYNGVKITGDNNNIIGTFFEGNSNRDVLCTGLYNSFWGLVCSGPGHFEFGAGGSINAIFGGLVSNLTISAACDRNMLFGVSINGTLADSSAHTEYIGCWDAVNAVPIPNRFPRGTEMKGYVSMPLKTVTAATYTITDDDYSIIGNRAGTITITLPSAANYPGRKLRFKTIQAQAINATLSVINPLAGGATTTSIVPATAGKWCDLQANGTNWEVMASN